MVNSCLLKENFIAKTEPAIANSPVLAAQTLRGVESTFWPQQINMTTFLDRSSLSLPSKRSAEIGYLTKGARELLPPLPTLLVSGFQRSILILHFNGSIIHDDLGKRAQAMLFFELFYWSVHMWTPTPRALQLTNLFRNIGTNFLWACL